MSDEISDTLIVINRAAPNINSCDGNLFTFCLIMGDGESTSHHRHEEWLRAVCRLVGNDVSL